MTETKTYGGQLKDFPPEIVAKMLFYQVQQGNKEDVSVFEKDRMSNQEMGGFDWGKPEGYQFWECVILDEDFDQFFELYPKEPQLDPLVEAAEIMECLMSINTIGSPAHEKAVKFITKYKK